MDWSAVYRAGILTAFCTAAAANLGRPLIGLTIGLGFVLLAEMTD